MWYNWGFCKNMHQKDGNLQIGQNNFKQLLLFYRFIIFFCSKISFFIIKLLFIIMYQFNDWLKI